MRNILYFLFILISTDCYPQLLGEKFIYNPIKRVDKIIYLESNDLSVPDCINDSTTSKIYEKHFSYTGNKVSKIETKWFQNKDCKVTFDSIVYISHDTVKLFKSANDRLITTTQNLPKFLDIFDILNKANNEKRNLKIPNTDLIFKINGGVIKKIVLEENGLTYNSIISYDSKGNPHEFIIKTDGRTKGESWCRIRYLNEKDYELNCGSGKMWYFSYFYYFDQDSYLIKRISESDTNPHIMIINYENGIGNASDFIYYHNDILTLNPMIY